VRDETHDAIVPGEDLVANARIALRVAPSLCVHGCDWYHGLYPVLRLLGLAATPARHARFFHGAFAALRGAERLLVAGAADTAMASLAARALPGAAITVLDRCPTPLALCREQAARQGVPLVTEACDLLAPAAPDAQPFDLACTHSLLGMVPPADRGRAIASLAARLRPGGRLVSTNRIDAGAATSRYDPDAAARFRARVEAGAASLPGLGVDPAAIAALARRYTEKIRSWPFASANALAAALEAGDFAVEQLEVVEIGGAGPGDATGAGTARAAAYAEFVAARAGSRPSNKSMK
jgi:SAM-dependent methyltransferase